MVDAAPQAEPARHTPWPLGRWRQRSDPKSRAAFPPSRSSVRRWPPATHWGRGSGAGWRVPRHRRPPKNRATSRPLGAPFVPSSGYRSPNARRHLLIQYKLTGSIHPPPTATHDPSSGAQVSTLGTNPLRRPMRATASAPLSAAGKARSTWRSPDGPLINLGNHTKPIYLMNQCRREDLPSIPTRKRLGERLTHLPDETLGKRFDAEIRRSTI
jgi:hypothetical protein